MNYKELSRVAQTTHKKEIKDSKVQTVVENVLKRRKARKVEDSHKYSNFSKTAEYRRLCRKVKDALEDTETTEEAVEAALAQIDPETPAEQTLAAVVETLSDVIEDLQETEVDPDDTLDE
jgi:hypothetical protein